MIRKGRVQMSSQEKPIGVVVLQGLLMVGIAIAPAATGFRFFFPRDIWDWIGTFLMIIGTGIVVTAVRTLRKTFTIQAAVKSGTKLVTNFPFNFSRNPMYVGGLIQCFSWSLLQRSILAAVLTVLLWVLLNAKVKIEEKNLELIFGKEYTEYKNRVSRFL